jgi:succinate dehydrogenase / fumarate reductase cytochrome b subunit
MNDSVSPSDKRPLRPLSPHIQIYRWQLTMVTSILHRISGAALALGVFAFTWLMLSAAIGPDAWGYFMGAAHSLLGRIALFGWVAAAYYHLCNGIRHLVWDTGHLFKIEDAYLGGYIALAVAAFMTVMTWWTILGGGW